eukprot:TRINITY_DN18972_c0_g1_i1.p1 TRINITY_DN18972_c0_g1~~TRINITY_DN18972_c0_g1_i1.p1  ORF type:complete len:286 (+),score=75.06 TRINITY_DN18972_c0_g1_i1:59-916(+)
MRPEHQAPPEIVYNEDEVDKYENKRMQQIQSIMTDRAVELLELPDDNTPRYILDIGCGSGLSGMQLTENGHYWIGMDIAPAMLDRAVERGVEGDLMLQDMGQGVPFRSGIFDGCISISVLQWLCNADKAKHNPRTRMTIFFQTLYNSMSKGARCVFQFYPENQTQTDLLCSAAKKCGFDGGLVIDFPNATSAKKTFLVLSAGAAPGTSTTFRPPKALSIDDGKSVKIVGNKQEHSSVPGWKKEKKLKVRVKSRAWVMKKKEGQEKKGFKVRENTKYTARKRRDAF